MRTQNYKKDMAEILDFTLEINGIDKTIKSVEDLEQSIKDLQNTIKSNVGRGVLDNTELEKNLARLEKLRLEAKATREAIKQTSVDGARSMGTLREAFDGAGAAAEILSGENEKVGRVVMTVMKAIGAANSVREVSENKSTIAVIGNRIATTANIAIQKLYNATLASTIMSLNTFKIALAATGIGAIILLLGVAVMAYNKFKGSVDFSTEALDRQKKAMDDLRRSKELTYREMAVQGRSETEINNQKIKDYNRQAEAYERMTEGMRDNDVKVIAGENFTREQLKLRAREYRVLAGEADIANRKIREGNKKTTDDTKNDGKDLADAIRQNQLRAMDDRSRELDQVRERYDKELQLVKGNLILEEMFKENQRKEIADINKKYDDLEAAEKKKSDDERIAQEKQTTEELKKLREDEFSKSLGYSKEYYTEQQTLLLNRATEGYNIDEEMRRLELEGLEAQLQVYRDYGESTIEIENQIASKKREIRDAERQATIESVNAGIDTLRAGIQASMDLEAQRTENALNNQNLTEEEREKIARASFEKQKKLQLQMAYVDAAKSVTSILAQYPKFDGGIAMFAAIATSAIMNTAAITRIKRTKYQGGSAAEDGNDAQPSKFARGGVLVGPLHSQGGIRTSFGELEGGEFVVNRRSTRMYGGLISAINQAGGGRKYATGGILGLEDQLQSLQSRMNQAPVVKAYVLEGDISSAMEAEQKIKYRTSL